MGARKDATPKRNTRRLVGHFLFSVWLAAAAVPGWAQQTPLQVILSDTEVRAGGQFTLTFDVSPALVDTLQVVEPAYPDALQKDGGPLIRPAIAGTDPTGPAIRNTVEVQVTFTALRPGRFVIGSFVCDSGNQTFTTEPVVVSVTDPAHGNTVPPDARWIVSTQTPYQGQAVFLELVLDNLLEPVFPDQVSVTPPATGVFEEVRGLGKIETRNVGATTLYQVPVATYYLTPTAAGKVSVPSATVRVKGINVAAPQIDLSVQGLPQSVQGSGAVGSFSYSASVANPEISEGDSFDLTLRVEGTGNLGYMHFPDVTSSDLVVTSSGEQNRYVATETGYTGYREVTYQLSPRGPGTVRLSLPGFAWIDPATGQVHQLGSQVFSLKTDPAAISASATDSGAAGPTFTLLSVAQIRKMEPIGAFRNPLNYLWLLPGIIVLVVLLLLRRSGSAKKILPFLGGIVFMLGAASARPPFPEKEVQAGINAFQAGHVPEAISDFSAALSVLPHSPGILYNQALAYFQNGQHGKAVYYLDNAIRFSPSNGTMRQTIDWMEHRLNLTRQIEPPWNIDPDTALIVVAILFNVMCVLFAISGRERGGRYVIVLVFAVVLTLTAGGGLAYSVVTQSQEIGVVGGGAGNLLKIPRTDATSWLELPEGTTLRILLDFNDFYLVRTGYGVEGWLPAADVLYDILPVGESR